MEGACFLPMGLPKGRSLSKPQFPHLVMEPAWVWQVDVTEALFVLQPPP